MGEKLRRWQYGLGLAAIPAMLFAMYMGFLWAPEERTLGPIQRIFYFHVGSAWNAYLAFFIVFVVSILYLVRRRQSLDMVAVAAAEVGIVFTILTLITGTFWARASWNTWWTFDPRLTTTAIMLFMYIAYLLVRAAADGEDRRGRLGAVFGIVAFATVPLVHYSATWWRGMHPTVIDIQGQAPKIEMDERMLTAMMVGLVALTVVAAYLVLHRLTLEQMTRRTNLLKERVRMEVEH